MADRLKALITAPSGAKNWKEPYIDETTLLTDPWGNPYQYRYPSTHGVKYDVWSYGPDGKDGTQDDICNWPQ